MEVGPYKIKGENLEYRDGSWDEYANLLFVDQPVGTGFSYVDTDSFLHELDEVAKNMVTFLDKWFALFPQYLDDDVSVTQSAGEMGKLTKDSYTSLESPLLASTFPTLPKLSSIATRTLDRCGT